MKSPQHVQPCTTPINSLHFVFDVAPFDSHDVPAAYKFGELLPALPTKTPGQTRSAQRLFPNLSTQPGTTEHPRSLLFGVLLMVAEAAIYSQVNVSRYAHP